MGKMEVAVMSREYPEARRLRVVTCLLPGFLQILGGWGRGGQKLENLEGTFLSPHFHPFPGYFFTWTWRHRVSD